MAEVSVVVPTYNRSAVLQETIASYLSQPHLHELILVDDGSSGEQADFYNQLARDKRLRLLRYTEHKGLPTARNTGVAGSTGEYVFFGEDDVLLDAAHLDVLVAHLQEGDFDVMAGRLVTVSGFSAQECATAVALADAVTEPLIDMSTFTGRFHVRTATDVAVPFVHACALAKRSVFERVRYDEHLTVGTYFREETDFYMRALAAGYRIGYCPHALAYHRMASKDTPRTGGCGPKVGMAASLYNQLNNIRFAWRNRAVLRAHGVGIVPLVCRSLLTGASRTLRRRMR